MFLEKIWESGDPPGTIEDFLQFIGVENVEQIEEMDCAELMNLPFVRREILSFEKGENKSGGKKFFWCWKSPKISANGEGASYEEAALEGLVDYWMCWELWKEFGCA